MYWPPHLFSDIHNPSLRCISLWIGEQETLSLATKTDEEKKEIWKKKSIEIMKKAKQTIRKLEDYLEQNGVYYLGPTENPGRQGDVWTSSFNPVVENPRDYYPPNSRISQIFISHETALLLKCIMGEDYRRDIFREILNTLAKMLYIESMYKIN